eukprot:TRINITY_DN457_c0_g3_i2.p1 TRINITY_DN457_c0_g3~~TRINITY_DN457_c0_g3_i2.p1  ORF type:complete len:132 (-),score=17.39 TRINITY_DN457_c0_g3_i2:319-714(-)
MKKREGMLHPQIFVIPSTKTREYKKESIFGGKLRQNWKTYCTILSDGPQSCPQACCFFLYRLKQEMLGLALGFQSCRWSTKVVMLLSGKLYCKTIPLYQTMLSPPIRNRTLSSFFAFSGKNFRDRASSLSR